MEPALLYIDESGQFRRPRAGDPDEWGVVAGVVFRDAPQNRARIAATVRAIRDRHGPAPKAAEYAADDWMLVTDLVHEIGYPRRISVRYDATHTDECARAMRELESVVCRAARKVVPDVRVLAEVERTRAELAAARERGLGTYIVQLALLVRQFIEWFRDAAIVPRVSVTLDEKIPREATALAGFLCRFAVSTTFPERYGQRPGLVWGRGEIGSGWVSTDRDCDGLVIADALAYLFGRVDREQDTDGSSAAYLARLWRARD